MEEEFVKEMTLKKKKIKIVIRQRMKMKRRTSIRLMGERDASFNNMILKLLRNKNKDGVDGHRKNEK